MALQDDIDALRSAINLGAKSVKYADKEIVYRDLDEMRDILAGLEAQLSGKKAPRIIFTSSDKGIS